MIERSGSVPRTNGSGFRRLKIIDSYGSRSGYATLNALSGLEDCWILWKLSLEGLRMYNMALCNKKGDFISLGLIMV
jgi:hypothetical protein